jgi:hypothetical protein
VPVDNTEINARLANFQGVGSSIIGNFDADKRRFIVIHYYYNKKTSA